MRKIIIIGLIVTSGLFATAPMREGPYPGPVKNMLMPDTVDPLKLRFNYLYEFAQIAGFCADWQLDDADSVDHGGMIEAESGELADVIQTDNTQEAIWVWCRYGELTGDVERFRDNIEKAWIYCENFPAWEEEGASWDHYYRDHNSAWGIAAEQRYRSVYGDDSYEWYRDCCTRYIMDHPLVIYTRLNRFVTGWCTGWLYIYSQEFGDGEARDTALARGDALIDWVESMTPDFGLREEYWAMSSGTLVWGICNSSLTDDTLRGQEWIAANGPYLDTFQAWKNIDYYSWDNSWNVGFANGHWAMYDISADPTYARHHKWLTHKLLSYDTDNDGGIMATTQDADTTDMSWVSAYLCMMGLDRLIGEVYDYDAGALEIVGLYDGIEIEPGSRIDLVAVVSNYGREPLSNVGVTLSGDASGSATSDLEFLGMDTITLVYDWLVPEEGTLTLAVSHPQDENPNNDTLIVGVNKTAGVREEPITSPTLHLEVSTLTNGICHINYAFSESDAGRLALYDALGARIKRETLLAGEGSLEWDISELSAGIYFIRLDAGETSITSRFVFLR